MAAVPVFWILAALLVVGTLGIAAWPLLRARARSDAPAVDVAAMAVLRDQ